MNSMKYHPIITFNCLYQPLKIFEAIKILRLLYLFILKERRGRSGGWGVGISLGSHLLTIFFVHPVHNAAYFFVTVFALKRNHHCPGTNVVF